MLNLIIESCTEQGFIALMQGNTKEDSRLLGCEYFSSHHTQSQEIFPALKHMLAVQGKSIQDLELITLSIGPGSYTGIRVGVSLAQTLNFALGIPMAPLCTLSCFCLKKELLDLNKATYFTVLDARISGVYIQKQQVKENSLPFIEEHAQNISIEKCEQLFSTQESNLLLAPSTQRLQEKFSQIFPSLSFHWEECAPSPQKMQHLALGMHKDRQLCHKAEDLELLYLRKTQAEIEKEQRRSL